MGQAAEAIGGEIIALLDRTSGYVEWQCPLCGDNGLIHGWEDTPWDRQRRREEFRTRLGAQAPRWSALGINFYRSPTIPWAP